MGRALKLRKQSDHGAVAKSGRAVAASAVPPAAGLALAAALLCAGMGAFTFHRLGSYGFSQDDFLGLARASGLAPRLTGLWRVISHQWFWDAMHATGASAQAGHVAQLAAHALGAALLAWLLARRYSVAAALVGGAFFATHPALFTGVAWLAANGDVGAALWSLLALVAFMGGGRARALALPAFAAALLCKESALPLPLALLALRLLGPAPRMSARDAVRDRVWLAMCAIAAISAALLTLTPAHAGLGGASYSMSPAAVLPNLLTYDGWAVNRWFATVTGFSDAVDRSVFTWGIALNVAWLAGLAVPALRVRGWAGAGIAYAAMLLPVLPLAHHAYHYYLYAALPAAALLIAIALDAAFAALPARAAGALALALSLFCAYDGQRLAERIETAPFALEGLRADPTIDRALIAANVRAALAQAALPQHAKLWFWSPESRAYARAQANGASGEDGPESYYERNLRAALLDGLAVRVMAPNVTETRFLMQLDPRAADSAGAYCALYRPDGATRIVSPAELQRAMAAAAQR
jgi:hypothetical protein